MNVAVEQGKIRLYSPVPESDEAIIDAFDDLAEAQRDLDNALEEGGRWARQADEHRQAVEDRLRDLFSETVSIEQAETLVARLSGAIVQAKVHAGRFNAGDEVGQ